MTKEITKAIILQELQDKFKLREFEDAKFLFDETVVPTYDVGRHVEDWKTEFDQKNATGIGSIINFTVPPTERWHLSRYDVVFMGIATVTVGGVFFSRGSGKEIYLDLTAGQTMSYHVDLGIPAILNPGNSLRIYVDGYTSTMALRLYIDYKREEIR